MTVKKKKCCKTSNKKRAGWFWEDHDPIFGKSNRWIKTAANDINDGLKRTKILSSIAAPIAGFAATLGSFNPVVGTVAGIAASAGLKELGYGKRRRPHGKAMQHVSGSPFMNPNAACFGTIRF